MKTIYKYQIGIADEQGIPMPKGAKILSVGIDPGGALCLWALVDTTQSLGDRRIRLRGTGQSAEGLDAERFIGTVQTTAFMWHVFEGT